MQVEMNILLRTSFTTTENRIGRFKKLKQRSEKLHFNVLADVS